MNPVRASMSGFASGLLMLAFVAAAAKPDVPVIVGAEEELDACGSWAEVSGLNPKGDGFLAVRGGPGSDYPMRDRLRTRDAFFVCDVSRDGKWMAIVYPRKRQTADACNVSGAIPKAREYRGPCASGWVNAAWVRILAG
jgi:hypothetical protein